MEMRNENNTEKRRRKIISQPILVRSVKPGGRVHSATYSKESENNLSNLFKS